MKFINTFISIICHTRRFCFHNQRIYFSSAQRKVSPDLWEIPWSAPFPSSGLPTRRNTGAAPPLGGRSVGHTGVARILCWGAWEPRRRVRNAELTEAVERGGGIPLPSRLGGLGERRKHPQRGPGRSPGRKQILVHFELEKNESGDDKFDIIVTFIAHIYSQIYKVSFDIFFLLRWGARPLRPPFGYDSGRSASEVCQ